MFSYFSSPVPSTTSCISSLQSSSITHCTRSSPFWSVRRETIPTMNFFSSTGRPSCAWSCFLFFPFFFFLTLFRLFFYIFICNLLCAALFHCLKFCMMSHISSRCALHPGILAIAKIGVKSSCGIPSIEYTNPL